MHRQRGGHYDARGNVYPLKARPEQKIDAAGLIMAIARCMATQPKRSIYETRGLTFISLPAEPLTPATVLVSAPARQQI